MSRRRSIRRARPRRQFVALPREVRGTDPLAHARRGRTASMATLVGLLLLAVAVHAIAAVVILVMSELLGAERDGGAENERIEIALIERQPEPAVVPEPVVPKPAVAPALVPAPVPEPPVVAKRKRKPKPKAVPEPAPEAASEVASEPAVRPRRIVGINMESTVQGGGGPAFAVGNTRMGRTALQAADPNAVLRTDPGRPLPAPKARQHIPRNRAASRIPSAGVSFVKPRRLHQVKPEYPPLYRAQSLEGQVVVEVDIAATGAVTEVRIIGPSKHDEFNLAALQAAKKERFSPARRGGKAIAYRLSFSYRFRLSD